VFPSCWTRLAAAVPHAGRRCVYGSTEAEPIGDRSPRHQLPADRASMMAGCGLLAGHPVRRSRCHPGLIVGDASARPWSGPARKRVDRCRSGRRDVVAGAHVLQAISMGSATTKRRSRWDARGLAPPNRRRGVSRRNWTGPLLVGRCAAKASDARGSAVSICVSVRASKIEGVGAPPCDAPPQGRVLTRISGGSETARGTLLERHLRAGWTRLSWWPRVSGGQTPQREKSTTGHSCGCSIDRRHPT